MSQFVFSFNFKNKIGLSLSWYTVELVKISFPVGTIKFAPLVQKRRVTFIVPSGNNKKDLG